MLGKCRLKIEPKLLFFNRPVRLTMDGIGLGAIKIRDEIATKKNERPFDLSFFEVPQ